MRIPMSESEHVRRKCGRASRRHTLWGLNWNFELCPKVAFQTQATYVGLHACSKVGTAKSDLPMPDRDNFVVLLNCVLQKEDHITKDSGILP